MSRSCKANQIQKGKREAEEVIEKQSVPVGAKKQKNHDEETEANLPTHQPVEKPSDGHSASSEEDSITSQEWDSDAVHYADDNEIKDWEAEANDHDHQRNGMDIHKEPEAAADPQWPSASYSSDPTWQEFCELFHNDDEAYDDDDDFINMWKKMNKAMVNVVVNREKEKLSRTPN